MILAASLGAAKAYIDHQLHLELDSSLKSVADIITIKYSEINSSLLGSVYINNLRLTTKDNFSIHIDTVTLYKAYQFYKSNPSHISIAIQGLQIPISTASSIPVLVSVLGYSPYYITPKELHDLGLPNFKADVNIEAKLTQQKVVILATMNAHSWGKLSLSADLINRFPLKLLATTISQIQLVKLKLTYTGKGLVKRIFTKLARRNKMTIPKFKQMLLTKLKNDTNQMGLDDSTFSVLQQFIQTPTMLAIHLQPVSPIAINALLNSSPKYLGLKFIALH